MRIATGALRPRNDRGFLHGVRYKSWGRTGASAPTTRRVRNMRCGGALGIPQSASPTAPFRQGGLWCGALQGVRWSTPQSRLRRASSPYAGEPLRTGVTDCHSQCAHWLRNDRLFYMGCGARPGGGVRAPCPTQSQELRYRPGGRTEASAPTEGLQPGPAERPRSGQCRGPCCCCRRC